MIIIGLAGKNRMAKGSCALHLQFHRSYDLVDPDTSCINVLPMPGEAADRVVISNLHSEAEAAFLRAQGGIVVHVIGPRDRDCVFSDIAIAAEDFVVHGCSDDPKAMHEQIESIAANHELSSLTEMRRHVAAG